jgi:hypothetical protein
LPAISASISREQMVQLAVRRLWRQNCGIAEQDRSGSTPRASAL